MFAVAITLLVLDLHVPNPASLGPRHTLAGALEAQWPVYLAYVLSFATVLITWLNHHALFRLIRRADHTFLLLNGLLLLVVTTLPFVTELLAAYLRQPDRRTAMIIYSGISVLLAAVFNRMWAYASHGGRLLGPEADPAQVAGVTRAYAHGPAAYLAAFALAFVNAWASLAICILLALYYGRKQV